MYVNKCTKCGSEFETKNPKRVICPNCLYPDKKMMPSSGLDGDSSAENNAVKQENDFSQHQEEKNPQENQQKQQFYSSYSYDNPQGQRPPQRNYDQPRRDYNQGGYNRPQGGYNRPQQDGYQRPQQGGYNRPQGGYNRPQQDGYQRPQQGGYNRPQGGYNRPQQDGYQRPQQGGYNRPQGGYNRPQQDGGYQRPQQGGYNRPQGGYNRPQQSGYGRPQGGPRFNKRPPMQRGAKRPLLINKEQLEQIELLYKAMLPLPNPDAHEVIGAKIELEPKKVFFGINLVRQKMMLPKLPFPKRKLAISPDQMFAIQNLYEPLLPVPPIGCHKIIASQLKMDEWRVHVGIGLIRAKMGLNRWNQDRPDVPEEFKQSAKPEKTEKPEKETKAKKSTAKTTKEKASKTVKAKKEDKEEKEVKEKKPRKTKKADEEKVEE